MPPESAIDVAGLVKHYHASDGSVVRAVNGVSFTVQEGEMVGLLGANGAGKTTTLRMLGTLLEPTAGTARVAGCDVRRDPVGVRRRIGYVSATTGVPDRLTPREIFASFGRVHGLPSDTLSDRVTTLLKQLDLTHCADRPAGRLSSGQRQRVSLGRALVHDPPALVLDEPTNALDVVGARDLLVLLAQLRSEGHAILLSTHRLHEIEARCDRFVIIHDGSVVAAGTRDHLVAEWLPGRDGELEDAFFAAIGLPAAAPGPR
ncbi:MAG: ABC transporter ATP-binding protein, partial [Planctomycetia bacterium]|nr:ABC transporter ATP-binding protein [Planctomycetia bacterium]